MSIVWPPPAGELLLELPLLLLLLQPTAAKAIAAKAAIAVVRLMIFLSLFEIVWPPPSALAGPLWAHGLLQPEAVSVPEPLRRPDRLESMPAKIPGRANVAAGTSAADSPTLVQSRAVRRLYAELRPDESASSWRSASPGSGGHGYRPLPFDVSPTRPSPQALMTVIAAVDRGCSAAGLFRSSIPSTESLPDSGLAGH